MRALLVSYANPPADVGDHVGFGVDPPAIADFFRLLSLGSGRIFAIIVALRSSLAGKSKHVGDKAVRTVAPQCTVRGGQVQKGTQRNSSIAAGDFGAVARHGLCPQGRSSLTAQFQTTNKPRKPW